MTGGAHAIHGESWQHPWNVAEASRSSARLVLEHPATIPESWPFPFGAEQLFVLTENGLTITLAVTNTAPTPQPAGFGLHPYFPRLHGVTLGFPAASVWQNGADHLPLECTSVPPEWDFSRPRMLEEPRLDNCFAGWAGTAEITWPAAGRTLRVGAERGFGHAVVFAPECSDAFAFEPVSHINDAINRLDFPGHGLVTLPPGGTISGTVRFTVARTSFG